MKISRALLGWVVVVGALTPVFAPGASPAVADTESLRVYVLVTDGLDPEEVTPELMPNLAELKGQSTWYDDARAVFPAETLPNHAAMMTGVLPARNGIVANQAWDRKFPGYSKFYVQLPRYFTSDTLTTQLENACDQISTATVLSKTYLWNVFDDETSLNAEDPQLAADFHWNPFPVIPQSDHTIDIRTMDALTDWSNEATGPQFAFVNLGDIDRSGHADPGGSAGGPSMAKFRQTVMGVTDGLIGDFVEGLKTSGAWDNSVVIVASDHSMDWSPPNHGISIRDYLTAAGLQGGPNPVTNDFMYIHNGASELVYIHDGKEEKTQQIVDLLQAHEGIEHVIWDGSEPSITDYGMDAPNFGADIVALSKPGWRFDEQSNSTGGNPLPGNHGSAITQHSTLMVTGGASVLDDEAESVAGEEIYVPGQMPRLPQGGPGNLSIAPTVAMLFGLDEIPGGYDGSPLLEAFDLDALEDYDAPCDASGDVGTSAASTTPVDRWRYITGTSNNRTAYSDGTGTPADAFAAGKGSGLGFTAVTDKTDFQNAVNPVPVPEDCTDPAHDCITSAGAGNRWERTGNQARAASDRDFLALRGWQWASDYQGSVSVLAGEGYKQDFTARDGGSVDPWEAGPLRTQRKMDYFWSWFTTANRDGVYGPEDAGDSAGVAVFQHPGLQGSAWNGDECAPAAANAGDPPNVFEDFRYVPDADPFVVGADVFSSGTTVNDLRYESCYRRALSKGWHVGAFAGTELLSGWGSADAPVAVLQLDPHQKLSRRAVTDTMLARRFYATRDRGLRLDFNADGAPMGSRLENAAGANVDLQLAIDGDPSDLVVELIGSDGSERQAVIITESGIALASWQGTTPAEGEAWYYARVFRNGALTAVTSPIWIAASVAP